MPTTITITIDYENPRRRSRRLPPHPLLRRAIIRRQTLILTPDRPFLEIREASRLRGIRDIRDTRSDEGGWKGVWKRGDLVGWKRGDDSSAKIIARRPRNIRLFEGER